MITLYSTHCPKCKQLERELAKKNVEFEIVDNTDQILDFARAHGLQSAPILQVDDQVMKFEDGYKYVKELN